MGRKKKKSLAPPPIEYSHEYDKIIDIVRPVSDAEITPEEGARNLLLELKAIVDRSKSKKRTSPEMNSFRNNFLLLIKNVTADASSRVMPILDCVAKLVRLLALNEVKRNQISASRMEETLAESDVDLPTIDDDLATVSIALLNATVNLASDYINSDSSVMRFHCATLLEKVLASIPNEAPDIIEDDIIGKLTDRLLFRIKDPEAKTRRACAIALKRLQDPTDPDCPVMKELSFALQFDPSPMVRKAVIDVLQITKATYPMFFGATHDCSEAVRCQAVKLIATKVNANSLKTRRKTELLNSVFVDSAEKVRVTAKNFMFPAWMDAENRDPIRFLENFNLSNEKHAKAAKLAISLFCDAYAEKRINAFESRRSHSSESESSEEMDEGLTPPAAENTEPTHVRPTALLVPLDKLSPAVCFYWLRIVTIYPNDLPKNENGQVVFRHPTLTEFTRHLEKVVKKFQALEHCDDDQKLMVSLLFDLACVYAKTGDDFGINELQQRLKVWIVDEKLADCLMEKLVATYCACFPSIRAYQATNSLLELIPQLLGHVSKDITIPEDITREEVERILEDDNELKMKECQLIIDSAKMQMQMEEHVTNKDFLEAERKKQLWQGIKEELEEVQTRLKTREQRVLCDEPQVESEPPDNLNQSIIAEHNEKTLGRILHFVRLTLREEIPHALAKEKIPANKQLLLTAEIQSILEKYVMDGVRNPDPLVRCDAFTCIGLIAFRSLEVAVAQLPLLFQPLQVDVPLVRIECMNIISDLLLFYGQKTLGVAADGVMVHISQLLEIPMALKLDSGFLTAVVETVCKLFIQGRSTDVDLLRKLLLLNYHPEVRENIPKIQKIVATFLTAFSCSSHCNQELLAQTIVPIAKALYRLQEEHSADPDFRCMPGLRETIKPLMVFTSQSSLLKLPRDLPPGAIHYRLGRFILEAILKSVVRPNCEELTQHFMWMLEQIEVFRESAGLFELRDTLFALWPNDDVSRIRKIHKFFRRLEATGASYDSVRNEYEHKPFVDLDATRGLQDSAAPARTPQVEPMEVDSIESRPSNMDSHATSVGAAVSKVSSLAMSSQGDNVKGKFFGRYSQYVMRHQSKQRGRNPHLLTWGVRDEFSDDEGDNPEDRIDDSSEEFVASNESKGRKRQLARLDESARMFDCAE